MTAAAPSRRAPAVLAAVVLAILALLAPRQGSAQAIYETPEFTIAGSGARPYRQCRIKLRPQTTYGGDVVPVIELDFPEPDRLRLSLADAVRFSDVTIVVGGSRYPWRDESFAGFFEATQIRLVQALWTRRPVYVTARSGGAWVSSQFLLRDSDAMLRKIGEECPNDVEALSRDPNAGAAAERGLNLDSDDITYIRWALNVQSGRLEKPFGGDLTLADRQQLRQHTRRSGLPVSRWLTRRSADELIRLGQKAEAEAKEREKPEVWVATAAGIHHRGDGVAVVTIGSAIRSTRESANSAAIAACRDAGGRTCAGVTQSRYGCLYITTGAKGQRVRWMQRATRDQALADCREGGFRCKPPIGGCSD